MVLGFTIIPRILLLCTAPALASSSCYTTLNIEDDVELRYAILEDEPRLSKICPWSIRTNGSSTISLEVTNFIGNPNTCDSVLSLHFLSPDSSYIDSLVMVQSCETPGETVFTVSGPLAFITFDSKTVGDGFSLIIKRSDDHDPGYPYTSIGTDIIFSDNFGKISHFDTPELKELSSFIIAPKDAISPSFIELHFPETCRTSYDVESPCDASLQIYSLIRGKFHLEQELHKVLNHIQFWGDEMFIIIYQTQEWEYWGDHGGFEVTWKIKTPAPTTSCGRIIDLSRGENVIEYSETDSDRILRYNQQCVWTIRAPGIENVRITVEKMEILDCTLEDLYVTGFTNETYEMGKPMVSYVHYFKTCEVPAEPVIVTGPLLFLVFIRSPGSFRFRIERADEVYPTSYPFLSNYSDIYLTEGAGNLYWPTASSISHNWRANEYTTFLMNPDPVLNFRQTKLRIGSLLLGQADSCWSSHILIFEIRHGLRYQYMLCDQKHRTYVNIYGDHSVLILLRTSNVWTLYQNTISFSWNPVI